MDNGDDSNVAGSKTMYLCRRKMDNMVAPGTGLNTIRLKAFNHHLNSLPYKIPVSLQTDLILSFLEPLQTFSLDLIINLVGKICRAGIGSVGIFKGKRAVKTNSFQQVHGLLKILFAFTGKADNHIRADSDFRTKGAKDINFFQVEFTRVFSLHSFQDSIRS